MLTTAKIFLRFRPGFLLLSAVCFLMLGTSAKGSNWTINGTVVMKDGVPFFAKGLDYAPTPIGGATYQPGVGDWFAPPWWTGMNDMGARDLANFNQMGVNALRTYFTWYWMPDTSLTYLAGITQSSPLSTNPITGGKGSYTVSFDHTKFLNACQQAGVYVVLGIGLDGGNCFNFASPTVSSAYQNFYLQTAEKLATLYGSHPAVMGFCLSNEQNNAARNTDSRVWAYYQKMRNAIKSKAPNKLVTIGFQDDGNLYNGTLTVTDPAGAPPTSFNNQPVEKVISEIVDVWGLNIYSGMSSDFPNFQTHVIDPGYGRPLWVTEWGTPGGKNVPNGASGPPDGSATAVELSPTEMAAGAQAIIANATIMSRYVSFISGGFYFEYCDEWWKNGFTPVTEQNASSSPDWPEEWWGLYSVAASNGRSLSNPDPSNPDTLTPRQPLVDAVTQGYQTIEAAFNAANVTGQKMPTLANWSGGSLRQAMSEAAVNGRVLKTPWGTLCAIDSGAQQWYLEPFGPIELLGFKQGEGIRVRLLKHDGREVFLPAQEPNYMFDDGLRTWFQVVTGENTILDPRIRVFDLTPPTRRQQHSELVAPVPQVTIP